MKPVTRKKPPYAYASVPTLWPNSTIVCLATGPSLTREDVEYCRGKAKVIAIKDAVKLAPWADVLCGSGADGSQWWSRFGEQLKSFTGLRFTLDPTAQLWADVLENTGLNGLERQATGIRAGHNTGYQAINIAVHLGASTIILLGYDMQPGEKGRNHFFGEHPRKNTPPYALFLPPFDTLVAPLKAAGVTVLNASRVSALKTFPRVTLEDVLPVVPA